MSKEKQLTDTYRITGVDKSGKRFTPIITTNPQHYNIWRGTLWQLYDNNIRKLIKRY